MTENKSLTKKITSIVLNVLMYTFLILAFIIISLSIFSKKDSDGAMNVLGHQMRIVVSKSMEKDPKTDVSKFEIKDIPIKSMIFIELVPEDPEEAEDWYDDLEIGDVLTFKYTYVKQETITHRIVEITEKPTGGYIIELEGDNKASDSKTLKQTIDTSLTNSPNFVIGKVTGTNYLLGVLVTAVKNPVGIILMVMLPCLVMIVLQIIKIVLVLGADKKKKMLEEKSKQDEEIEKLKQQLAMLQNNQGDVKPAEESNSEEINEQPIDETKENHTEEKSQLESKEELQEKENVQDLTQENNENSDKEFQETKEEDSSEVKIENKDLDHKEDKQ